MDGNTFKFSRNIKLMTYFLMGVGIIGLIVGWIYYPQRTWADFLINSFYFLTLSLSGLVFVAINHVSNARWSEPVRHLGQSLAHFLPVGSLIMLGLFFGIHSLYHWSHHDAVLHDHLLQHKEPYLNISFFYIRLVIILGIWNIFAFVLRRNSRLFHETGDEKYYKANTRNSAIFLILFAFSFSVASFDWIMSLEPHWYSTIFAVYNFSGMFVQGIAAVSLMAVVLKEWGYLKELNDNHFHDLGKLLFAFSMFWAYIWYSQFVLIWYGNIPEETIYFVNRLKGDWDWLFYFNFFINFLVPFFVLMPRGSKRRASLVKRVAIVLLIGHWLDVYLMVAPGTVGDNSSIGLLEIAITLGFAGIFMHVIGRALSKTPLMPRKSYILEESLHYHQ
jgi:hypothetical protein